MIQEPLTGSGLLLSGGLDSSILLGHLLAAGQRVQPFYIRSNLIWQREELASVQQFLGRLGERHSADHPRGELLELVVLNLPLDDLYGDHWSITGDATPGAASADEAVFLPGRNPLLVIKAALWCALNGIGQLALATLAGNPFADAGDSFFADYEAALNLATGGHAGCAPVRLVRPFAGLNKNYVMQLGRDLPLDATFSCIRPVGGQHCGACNKCAERQKAFCQAGISDMTRYAEQPGWKLEERRRPQAISDRADCPCSA